jgi:hypothetical protein
LVFFIVEKLYIEKKENFMKYIRNFESYRNFKNSDETLNEEFLGGIFGKIKGMFKNMANRRKQLANKVKGIKEIDVIYQKYLDIIKTEIGKQAKINLTIKSSDDVSNLNKPKPEGQKKNEKYLIREADAAPVIKPGQDKEDDDNTNLTKDDLVKKQALIKKIADAQKLKFQNEIKKVLDKYKIKSEDGKSSLDNEELKKYVEARMIDFDIAILQAEVESLDKNADPQFVAKIQQQIKTKTDESSRKLQEIGSKTSLEVKIGDKSFFAKKKYRYKTEDGVKTIMFIGKSEEDGKIKASFTYGDSAGKEQNFSVENVDFELEKNIEVGAKFGYYSENNKAVIDVEVVDKPVNGMVNVKTGKSEFKVEVGALIDPPKKEGQGQKEAQNK